MQPTQPSISRETVLIDRRQPMLRWSAVFAGAACSVGLWILLQLLGLGLGLATIDVDNVRTLHRAGITTTVWSLISPLIAMFFGGLLAGKLAQTYDRKFAGIHGVVMWAVTAVVGLCATLWIVAMIAASATRGSAAFDASGNMQPWATDRDEAARMSGALGVETADLLGPINQRLTGQGKPAITAAQLDAAMRGVARSGIADGNFDQELLVDQLVATTRLSRADATDVERQIETRMDARDGRAHELEHRVERHVLGAADAAGKALTGAGFSLLLSLLASVAGAVLALHRPKHRRGGDEPRRGTHTTEPGFAVPTEPVTTTPPYPSPMTGPATPVIPPTDITPR